MVPTLIIPIYKKSVSSVCGQEVTACFTSASVANRLPTRWFLRGPKIVEITGPHTSNWTGYSTWPEGYETPSIQPDLVLSDTQDK